MNEIESILDECLRRMSSEGLSVERLLALYPDHAAELRPLLETARRVQAGSLRTPRPGYQAEARARLLRQITTRPSTRAEPVRAAWRLAVAIASLVLVALATTTAFAQTAMPGHTLYGWKLGSEIIWRTVSADQVSVDLSLAERRTDEITTVSEDPGNLGKARDEFHEVLDRLEAEKDPQNAEQIDNALQAHQQKLEKKGIKDGKLDELVHGKGHQKP